jgi:hypothetical protein
LPLFLCVIFADQPVSRRQKSAAKYGKADWYGRLASSSALSTLSTFGDPTEKMTRQFRLASVLGWLLSGHLALRRLRPFALKPACRRSRGILKTNPIKITAYTLYRH